MTGQDQSRRLIKVTLDPDVFAKGTPDQEQERAVAIYDLVEQNSFCVPDHARGPYALFISMHDSKLALDIRDYNNASLVVYILSLSPFRRILKDYFLVCETYYDAIRTATPAQIEAIDMGRRALHNEGAALLEQRLEGKIDCDFDTIRRLFTLVTALHWRG
ncbi:MAG: UPF0262 family protein [Beijerinckiaceae bacterium]|jgi:uncharacterized protein (UPF0262 family)|nr:UPF0262 family protein [Beijerinckiaceae bacterium]